MTGRLTPRSFPRPLEAVVRRLRLLSVLPEAELELVRQLAVRRERYIAGDELVREGATLPHACFILSGWACRQRVLSDGRRQIFDFLLPGDGFGLNLRGEPELSSIAALTALETVDATQVLEAARQGLAPGLALALAALQ